MVARYNFAQNENGVGGGGVLLMGKNMKGLFVLSCHGSAGHKTNYVKILESFHVVLDQIPWSSHRQTDTHTHSLHT